MKRLLILLLLLLPVIVFGDNKSKNKGMPISRWKEIKRLTMDSSIVPFTDTLFISFMKKDSFSYHNKNGFIYNGTYKLEEKDLNFGTARYSVELKKPLSLVLTDGQGIYFFNRDSSDTVRIIVLDTAAEKILPVTSIDQLIGRWSVYKRETKEKASGSIDNATAIRSMFITGPSTDGKQGLIFSGKDPSNAPSWFIKNLGTDQSLNCGGVNARTLKVIKCQKGELVVEEDEVTYYLKQFK
jgi:hypothetical protein